MICRKTGQLIKRPDELSSGRRSLNQGLLNVLPQIEQFLSQIEMSFKRWASPYFLMNITTELISLWYQLWWLWCSDDADDYEIVYNVVFICCTTSEEYPMCGNNLFVVLLLMILFTMLLHHIRGISNVWQQLLPNLPSFISYLLANEITLTEKI